MSPSRHILIKHANLFHYGATKCPFKQARSSISIARTWLGIQVGHVWGQLSDRKFLLTAHDLSRLTNFKALTSLLVNFFECLLHLRAVCMGHVSHGQQSPRYRERHRHSHRLYLVHLLMAVKSWGAFSIRLHLKRSSHRIICLSLAQPFRSCAVFLQHNFHLVLHIIWMRILYDKYMGFFLVVWFLIRYFHRAIRGEIGGSILNNVLFWD